MLPILQFQLLLNGRHQTRPVIETIPLGPQSLSGPSEPCEPDQMLKLNRCQFIFIENLLAHRMQGKANVVVKECPVLLLECRPLKLSNGLRVGKMATRTVLQVRMSWSPGEFKPLDNNFVLNCPVSVTRVVKHLLRPPRRTSSSKSGWWQSQQLVGRLDMRSRICLCHPTNLEGGHIISYSDLPRVRHLHLKAENAGGGGILTAGPRGSARLKNGDGVGKSFRLPTLILSGDLSHHPAIN
ncbi:hypothetical protein Cgig2_026992 [Carnegiea gigantea]|uniref:Uncharacterized protein n=1 Tax=Carnegiea gigantea TaxID=171969 RepID=A0A9Q1GI23_9CARY|nr:hypothetical protein Cgig2_026992 [Carnegiea gigantea]